MELKKNLVITLQIPYNENTEEDVIRYCHEIVDEMKISPDFVKAELDGVIFE